MSAAQRQINSAIGPRRQHCAVVACETRRNERNKGRNPALEKRADKERKREDPRSRTVGKVVAVHLEALAKIDPKKKTPRRTEHGRAERHGCSPRLPFSSSAFANFRCFALSTKGSFPGANTSRFTADRIRAVTRNDGSGHVLAFRSHARRTDRQNQERQKEPRPRDGLFARARSTCAVRPGLFR